MHESSNEIMRFPMLRRKAISTPRIGTPVAVKRVAGSSLTTAAFGGARIAVPRVPGRVVGVRSNAGATHEFIPALFLLVWIVLGPMQQVMPSIMGALASLRQQSASQQSPQSLPDWQQASAPRLFAEPLNADLSVTSVQSFSEEQPGFAKRAGSHHRFHRHALPIDEILSLPDVTVKQRRQLHDIQQEFAWETDSARQEMREIRAQLKMCGGKGNRMGRAILGGLIDIAPGGRRERGEGRHGSLGKHLSEGDFQQLVAGHNDSSRLGGAILGGLVESSQEATRVNESWRENEHAFASGQEAARLAARMNALTASMRNLKDDTASRMLAVLTPDQRTRLSKPASYVAACRARNRLQQIKFEQF